MGVVGMAWASDWIRRPMRAMHGADFASYFLIQILQRNFAAYLAAYRMLAGIGLIALNPAALHQQELQKISRCGTDW
jgi:hypothetical protein